MASEISRAIVNRSQVEKKNDYNKYKDMLRYDFWYSCAYCTITENESRGIGFEIDHYYPKSNHPDKISEYNNLMWSCEKCNRYKGNYDSDDKAKKAENYVLRADECDPSDHYKLDKDVLKAVTHIGEFNIQLLYLNRLQLRRLRQYRRRFWEASKTIIKGVSDLRNYSLDKIIKEKRSGFLHTRKTVSKYCERLDQYKDFIIRAIAKSNLLDTDPESSKHTEKRRKFLKNQKAISHETMPSLKQLK